MHLLEAYSRTTGLRVEKMHVIDQFYPLPFENKYIVITTGTGAECRNYPHYALVVNFLRKHLNTLGYKIVQVGGKNDERVDSDFDACGRTTLYHLAYLIKNAELVICGDTSSLHLGGHYDKKIVSLFSVSHPLLSGSYFGNPINQKYLLPPDFNPTYTQDNSNLTVRNIKPEDIARAAMELLGVQGDLPKTQYIGYDLREHVLETVPNQIIRPDFVQGHPINIRFDKGGTEQNVFEQLKYRKSTLITNKPVNVNALIALKANLERVTYLIDENEDAKFVEALKLSGLPHALFSFLPDEKLQEIKLKYLDLSFIDRREPLTKPDLVDATSRFFTNRKILSEGKIYLSYAHLKEGRSVDSFEINEDNVIDTPDFWEDREFYYIFK